MRNQNISNTVLSLFEKVDMSNYKYVKFIDFNNLENAYSEEGTYMLICDVILNEWFCEFSSLSNLLSISEMEKYQSIDVINYLPIELYDGFKKLYSQLCTGEYPYFDSCQEQINYLTILCKLAVREKISIILDKALDNFDTNTWIALVKIGTIGIKDSLDEFIKYKICVSIFHGLKSEITYKKVTRILQSSYIDIPDQIYKFMTDKMPCVYNSIIQEVFSFDVLFSDIMNFYGFLWFRLPIDDELLFNQDHRGSCIFEDFIYVKRMYCESGYIYQIAHIGNNICILYNKSKFIFAEEENLMYNIKGKIIEINQNNKIIKMQLILTSLTKPPTKHDLFINRYIEKSVSYPIIGNNLDRYCNDAWMSIPNDLNLDIDSYIEKSLISASKYIKEILVMREKRKEEKKEKNNFTVNDLMLILWEIFPGYDKKYYCNYIILAHDLIQDISDVVIKCTVALLSKMSDKEFKKIIEPEMIIFLPDQKAEERNNDIYRMWNFIRKKSPEELNYYANLIISVLRKYGKIKKY
jgi:hypothetical protein